MAIKVERYRKMNGRESNYFHRFEKIFVVPPPPGIPPPPRKNGKKIVHFLYAHLGLFSMAIGVPSEPPGRYRMDASF